MHLVTSGVFMGVFRQRGPCPSVNYLFLYFRLLVQGGCVLLLVFAFHFAFPADARATTGCAGRRPRRPPCAASAGEVGGARWRGEVGEAPQSSGIEGRVDGRGQQSRFLWRDQHRPVYRRRQRCRRQLPIQ
jgi:hypothetical protein